MKRLFVVIIACIFLCSAAIAEDRSKPAGDGVKALLAAEKEILYVRNDGIYARNEQGDFKKRISCDEVHKTISIGDRIYVNAEENRSRILAYDVSGEKTAEYPLSIDGLLLDYAVTGSYLSYVYEEKQQNRTHLAVLNTKTGTVKEYNQLINPRAVAADGDYLIVSCDIVEDVITALILIDLRDGELTIAAENPPYGELHLNINEDVCYVTDTKDIYKISWTEQTSQTTRLPLSNNSEAFCIAGDMLYEYHAENGEISKFSLNDLQISTLTIAGYGTETLQDDPGITKTVSIFQNQYGAQVVLRFYSTVDDMILALMSGEPIDLLLLLNNFNYANFVKADVLADLNELPQIQALRESGIYSDWYFKLTGEQDRLSMLPICYVGCTLWEADATLLEQLNLNIPGDTWTWDDFLELAKQCKRSVYFETSSYSPIRKAPQVRRN